MLFNDFYKMFGMVGNYAQRKVDNTETDVFEVDTVRVTDRDWFYETAVKHKDFNNGEWIVVEGCIYKEEAQAMHDKWVKFMEKNDYYTLTDIWLEEDFKREVDNE